MKEVMMPNTIYFGPLDDMDGEDLDKVINGEGWE